MRIPGVQDLVRPPLALVYKCRADAVGRKTEEGFLIYKEAELDIDPEAGGTDLCPFDCECCKSRCSSGKGYLGLMLTRQASRSFGWTRTWISYSCSSVEKCIAPTIDILMHVYDIHTLSSISLIH